jgi:cob(I)alamin adenosyltransferase
MTKLEKGYIQVYTGNGKGKTTAALGQALRAAGRELRTLIVMLMKDFPYGELRSLHQLKPWIQLEQYGDDRFVLRKQPPSEEDIRSAQLAIKRAQEALLSGGYDLVILDEVCVAIHFGLLVPEDVISLMKQKPAPVELILTGRYCPPQLIAKADLVTEMQEIKHYYQNGVSAREGIES